MKQLFSDKRLLNYQQRVNRLRCFTIIFLILLLVPISVVFYKGFNQFEKDLLTEYQRKTEKITSQLNLKLFKRAVYDNAMSTLTFDYYQHIYNPVNQEVTRIKSPLSTPEYNKRFWGLIGYFQIDQQGQFNSPIWPEKINDTTEIISDDNDNDITAKKRKNLAIKLYQITSRSKELKALIDDKLSADSKTFSLISDVPEFLIFYRIIQVNKTKKLQGYVVDIKRYLNSRIERILKIVRFKNAIAVKVQPNIVNADNTYFIYESNAQGQEKITQTQKIDSKLNQLIINSQELRWPFKGYKLTYSTSKLELTTSEIYSLSLMLFLMAGIILGCYGFYRIGVKQLKLAEQRLNFVSSVSHELKTPLTSIRMYSEMLKSGMVPSEDYKAEYYEFIHSESERLSRLIDNILQLAKLSQPQHSVDPHYTKLSILTDIISSKVSSLLVNSDFKLNISSDFEQPEKILLLVDIDAFSQVVINITDNAVKFFDKKLINDPNRQKIDCIFKSDPKNKDQVIMEIRDYGIGISAEQESKIFELFYRGGSELTRTTQGTGIGLALVNELVLAQQGMIEVQRMTPGLSMKMSFKYKPV
jgi:nitrogen-specific signal transduction histidine kinase